MSSLIQIRHLAKFHAHFASVKAEGGRRVNAFAPHASSTHPGPPCAPRAAQAHNLDAPLGQPSSLPLSPSAPLAYVRGGKERSRTSKGQSPPGTSLSLALSLSHSLALSLSRSLALSLFSHVGLMSWIAAQRPEVEAVEVLQFRSVKGHISAVV